MATMGATVPIGLPADLAPTLRARVEELVAECGLARKHPEPRRGRGARRRVRQVCVECHRGGRLGGHHGPDGTVVWIHKSCHRRLHRAGRR